MRPIFLSFFLSGLLAPSLFSAAPVLSAMGRSSLDEAVVRAKTDSVGGGYCGRGLWSVLKDIGYGEGLQSADGQDWEVFLSRAGWLPLVCRDPNKAPLGSVLVYMSDIRRHGRNRIGTRGGIWGHAELVSMSGSKKVFVSDAARPNPGGTVPFNFTQRAWVPPGSVPIAGADTAFAISTFKPLQYRAAAEVLRDDRLAQARTYFSAFASNSM